MLTPERIIADALQHALASAYMEQAGMTERDAHETALEVLERQGAGLDLTVHDIVNQVRRMGSLMERSIFESRPGEESIPERLRREMG